MLLTTYVDFVFLNTLCFGAPNVRYLVTHVEQSGYEHVVIVYVKLLSDLCLPLQHLLKIEGKET